MYLSKESWLVLDWALYMKEKAERKWSHDCKQKLMPFVLQMYDFLYHLVLRWFSLFCQVSEWKASFCTRSVFLNVAEKYFNMCPPRNTFLWLRGFYGHQLSLQARIIVIFKSIHRSIIVLTHWDESLAQTNITNLMQWETATNNISTELIKKRGGERK